ncbi:MAG: class IV adenylate cyclase [Planctomycetes bacterium]|nr:class IV adenylate cyclase [Planctomycetota bacterium]
MKYEVEQKYPAPEAAATEERLRKVAGDFADAVEQVDRYFAHPARDFGQTDEALRIRRVGEKNYVTYKGPKLDAKTKTRREIELPLASGESAAEDFTELLTALGFRRVAEVRKRRRTARFEREGFQVEAALDDVDKLGAFVELELAADEENLDAARDCLAALAAELKLENPERRSYLELLLERVV